ncbi:hypothetical protein HPP92_028444 [Vanilla planifolia]|uniref:Uncharacterized protein n=1 Tax=Vanilla planifolia TaxID=51239 RepID=A0A835U5S3_VANPL|nr:hypothetical protein HPP92_028444 [Vanilla planifolia]KAG0447259.1 hypothetical protein HPP92_028446 [Vanilla planifolia]
MPHGVHKPQLHPVDDGSQALTTVMKLQNRWQSHQCNNQTFPKIYYCVHEVFPHLLLKVRFHKLLEFYGPTAVSTAACRAAIVTRLPRFVMRPFSTASVLLILQEQTSWANFWDKLSVMQKSGVLKGVNLEELSGSSVIKALTTWKRRPAILTFCHICMSGWTDYWTLFKHLLRISVTPHELFSVLDDASENTFLCAGTALSVQNPHGVTGGNISKLVFPLKRLRKIWFVKPKEKMIISSNILYGMLIYKQEIGSAFWDHQTSSVYKRR